jgi:Zn-dependent metalloprotease
MNTLIETSSLRGARNVRSLFGLAVAPGDGRRTIFNCHSRDTDGADVARTENGPPAGDDAVNRAYDGLGATRDFYHDVLNRNSIDDNGMRLDAYVHYQDRYDNAFWEGQKMVFGDGDGQLFTDFTKSLDVIGHELTHGVTQFTAGLKYDGQSGALNESISDVFGSLIKQWSLNQTADAADWLIGAEVFTPDIEGDALRSMKAPGTAYNNDLLGKDPQPDNMKHYVDTSDDNGGVHINSGIPNKAFYEVAIGIGGYAWQAPGHIWYESLKASSPDTKFQDFADTTYAKAGHYSATGPSKKRSSMGGAPLASPFRAEQGTRRAHATRPVAAAAI